MGSNLFKELDPIRETKIPGGEDGNYFCGITLLVEKMTCRD